MIQLYKLSFIYSSIFDRIFIQLFKQLFIQLFKRFVMGLFRRLVRRLVRRSCLAFFLIFLQFLFGIQSAFSSQSEEQTEAFEVKEDFGSVHEIFLPTILWDLLEGKKIINRKGKIENFSGEVKRFEENVFVGLTLRLKEKTPGILGGKNYEFRSKRSMGLFIDLANYIKGNKGTFIISFQPYYKIDPVSAQVLFLSESTVRKEKGLANQNQTLGGGCGRFFDITKSYLDKIKEDGIEVNISGGRHVSLLAGTFFFRVTQELGTRMLTHLTITDSKHPELLCDKIISKSN